MQALENTSYFAASKHKLSAFFGLIFRFSSCQHPLLASALSKITEDDSNRAALGKDESAVRQLLSMVLSENSHVVSKLPLPFLVLSTLYKLAISDSICRSRELIAIHLAAAATLVEVLLRPSFA